MVFDHRFDYIGNVIENDDNLTDAVKIYTDGACKGNPGPGGWGAVLIWGERVRKISGGEESTTNNRMELTAVIRALESLKRNVPVEIYSDSAYVVKGMTEWLPKWQERGWKRATGKLKNEDLWRRLADISSNYSIRWNWVKGHAGNNYNEAADRLATAAIPFNMRG